jgi:hypothetical protein
MKDVSTSPANKNEDDFVWQSDEDDTLDFSKNADGSGEAPSTVPTPAVSAQSTGLSAQKDMGFVGDGNGSVGKSPSVKKPASDTKRPLQQANVKNVALSSVNKSPAAKCSTISSAHRSFGAPNIDILVGGPNKDSIGTATEQTAPPNTNHRKVESQPQINVKSEPPLITNNTRLESQCQFSIKSEPKVKVEEEPQIVGEEEHWKTRNKEETPQVEADTQNLPTGPMRSVVTVPRADKLKDIPRLLPVRPRRKTLDLSQLLEQTGGNMFGKFILTIYFDLSAVICLASSANFLKMTSNEFQILFMKSPVISDIIIMITCY